MVNMPEKQESIVSRSIDVHLAACTSSETDGGVVSPRHAERINWILEIGSILGRRVSSSQSAPNM